MCLAWLMLVSTCSSEKLRYIRR